MATAYTPGLTVTRYAQVRKMRRLPLAGDVLVKAGQHVEPDDILARAELPGIMRTVRAAELMGVEPSDLLPLLQVKEGDMVQKGDILCRSTSFFGMFKNECKAPASGLLELINPLSGHIGIREAPSPVEVKAYVKGEVIEVIPREGAIVQTEGALIQGIFGIGGEQNGVICNLEVDPNKTLTASDFAEKDYSGCVLVGPAGADLSALEAAAERGAVGLVVGGVVDSDLVAYLGHDIGVAITGQEAVPTTIIITEGFGHIPMAVRTRELLIALEGRRASINGATQIRAGVIRPELIVPGTADEIDGNPRQTGTLDIGSPIRLIRDPYFGLLGIVAGLPAELQTVPSGAMVRVLIADLEDGRRITTPRANVELIEQ